MPTDRWLLGSTYGGLLLASWTLCACLFAGCGATIHEAGESSIDPSTLPEEIRAPYQVFTVHCSKCHSLSRPLTAHVSGPEHWTRYVRRMRRQPASGINPHDAEMILRFLYWYEEKKREDERREERESSDTPSEPARTQHDADAPTLASYAEGLVARSEREEPR